MTVPRLAPRAVELRSVSIPLKRPVVSKVGLFDRWPLILIDLHTEEGIVGPQLPRALSQAFGALPRPRHSRLGRSAQGPTGSTTRRFSDRGRAKPDRARVIALAE